ncbi:MAG: hypothetical protein LQ338_005636 [Usnochroma carphineum]|nr:MAG: hypothetical protein LQ338_005636 [Usnochroma carphineum]
MDRSGPQVRLTRVLEKVGNPVYWPEVAAAFHNRSKDDCRKRWAKMDERWRKGAWDSSENEHLARAVKQCGYRWTDISKIVGTRSSDQCAKHWRNFLDPNNCRDEWSPDDDAALAESVRRYGNDWKLIQEQFFPDRSRLDLSNRHVTLDRQHRRKQLSSVDSSTSSPTISTPSTGQHLQASNIPPVVGAREEKQLQAFIPDLESVYAQEPNDASWSSQALSADLNDILNSDTLHAVFSNFNAKNNSQNNELATGIRLSHESDDNNSDVLMSNTSSVSLNYALDLNTSSDYVSRSTAPKPPSALQGQPRMMLDLETQLSVPESYEPVTPTSTSEVTLVKKAKTVLTVENLDAETRAEILNLLFKRKLVTTIEII